MIWRFIPGFNDDYMMTKDGHVKHLLSGKVLEALPITIHGEMGVLMKNSDQFYRLILVDDLLCLTYPELFKKAEEVAVLCYHCHKPISQSLENGRWYHAKNRISCDNDVTHAKPGESWVLGQNQTEVELTAKQKAFLNELEEPEETANWVDEKIREGRDQIIIKNGRQMTFNGADVIQAVAAYIEGLIK
jgi:hypothetical protein